MNRILLTALFLLASAFVFAATPKPASEKPPDAYPAWLDHFLEQIKDRIRDDETNAAIQETLALKPGGNTGIYFKYWFEKAFQPPVQEYGIMLTDDQYENLGLIVAAGPEFANAEGAYLLYLEFVLKQIESYWPSLDDTKKRYLELFKVIKPKAAQQDYQSWFKRFNDLKTRVSGLADDDRTYVLDFMKSIKPEQNTNPTQRTYQVSEETLLKIRNLILNQQSMGAVKEIERILSGNSP